MPKEKPILFSGPMVRAILNGQKTVTRRIVKGAAAKWLIDFTPEFVADKGNDLCPYGQPGDRLWVREAWAEIHVAQAPGEMWVVYREGDNSTDYGGPWKPSIHMRRRDSRILLEITAVRIERLQDISRGDAMAEGCPFPNLNGEAVGKTDPVGWFIDLWERINGAESWAANPWVWVVEFKWVMP